MKETIILLGGGLLAGIIIMYLKDFLIKRFNKEIPKLIPEEEKTKLLDLYNKGLVTLSHLKTLGIEVEKKVEGEIEAFSGKKLATGMLKVNNGVLWAKDIASIFNLRKLIIVGVIIGLVFGYGYYKGLMGKPVSLNLQGKEATIKLNDHYLKIDKDGSMHVIDKDGKVLKDIKVKDIPELRKALRPYGLDMRPFVTAGGSLGTTGIKGEAGLGMQWLKWFKWHYDTFLTNVGIYPIGISYSITDNFDILAGGGYGYKGDQRLYIGGKWKF